MPWYSEACSSTLATTYSSGNQNEKQIVSLGPGGAGVREGCLPALPSAPASRLHVAGGSGSGISGAAGGLPKTLGGHGAVCGTRSPQEVYTCPKNSRSSK